MSTARPLVGVHPIDNPHSVVRQTPMPSVMLSPLRPDLVRQVHTHFRLNGRTPHGVSAKAGTQSSAQSWGTGRAVARISRVSGGGTQRSGQGAFGNQCRGGIMFSPTKTWRRWTRLTTRTIRRHAVASAVAATGIAPLVAAHGHKIEEVPEMPFVITDDFESINKTKAAKQALQRMGAQPELNHVMHSIQSRPGKGKMRGRRFKMNAGLMIVFNEDKGIVAATRNIPGVELCHISRLALLRLAPGGRFGRFVIWTESAFKKLHALYGTYETPSESKNNYMLPRPMMANADLHRIINSKEIQIALRPRVKGDQEKVRNINPLRSLWKRKELDPAFEERGKRIVLHKQQQAAKAKALSDKTKQEFKTQRDKLKAELKVRKQNMKSMKKRLAKEKEKAGGDAE